MYPLVEVHENCHNEACLPTQQRNSLIKVPITIFKLFKECCIGKRRSANESMKGIHFLHYSTLVLADRSKLYNISLYTTNVNILCTGEGGNQCVPVYFGFIMAMVFMHILFLVRPPHVIFQWVVRYSSIITSSCWLLKYCATGHQFSR